MDWPERWLSAKRLAPYLAACGDDIETALDLHEWNLRLGQVLLGDVAHFEVALRNAYARVLRNDVGDGWLFDATSPVRRPIVRNSKAKKPRDVNLINRRAIDDAIGRAHDGTSPDQVIAGLTLGFWVHLTDRSRERDLWIPHLYKAWPAGVDRSALNNALLAINKVRNRVAHSERLFDPKRPELSPLSADADAVRLLRQLYPEAAERLYGSGGETPVELFVSEYPAPAAVSL
ncbi:MAG: Abi family protein [Olsenella profusa]